jgi:hypothetical protein
MKGVRWGMVLGLSILLACGEELPSDQLFDRNEVATCEVVYNDCVDTLRFEQCCTSSHCMYRLSDGREFQESIAAVQACFDTTREIAESIEMPGLRTTSSIGAAASVPQPPLPQQEGCYGGPVSCQSRTSRGTCLMDAASCFWDEEICYGAARSCPTFSSASGCNGQLGCVWSTNDQYCYGSATQCFSRYNPGSCNQQIGCAWRYGFCGGSAGVCGTRSNPGSCNSIVGCYWR